VAHLLLRASTSVLEGWHKNGIAEYTEFFRHPRRVMWINLLGGVARGVGIAVGFTLVAAVLLWLLSRLASLNLPLIGHFIADLARIVEYELMFSK
jgi:hypothetical protein